MNTLERWRRVVGSITCASLPWTKLTIRVSPFLDGAIGVLIETKAQDRDGCGEILLTMQEGVTEELASRMSDAHVVQFVNRLVHRFAAHEVDEAFLVNGERYHDPHADEKAVAA